MPSLAEFLGTVLSDVSRARVAADVEAMKIAQAYAANTLLRHMPVPRFRLPEIQVEAPVLVEGVSGEGGGGAGKPPWEAPTAAELSKVMRRTFAEEGLRPDPNERRRAYRAVQRRARVALEAGPRALLDPRKAVSDLGASAVTALAPALARTGASDETRARVASSLKKGFEALLTQKLLAAPGLNVLVGSSAIKEHRDGESLVKIRLTVAEDAYELVTEAKDGETETRLVPE
ncbi:MAG TPA: hypothetical protein VFL83_02910 [Anaeromyxobacter sp.]|nr:hypothetical protein [Anaeromyxobacter sp.]